MKGRIGKIVAVALLAVGLILGFREIVVSLLGNRAETRELRSEPVKIALVTGDLCTGVGSLGDACNPQEAIAIAQEWADEVEAASVQETRWAVAIRAGQETMENMATLVNDVHAAGGLIIADAGLDYGKAYEVQKMVSDGLDGIAVEYNPAIGWIEISRLASLMERRSKEVVPYLVVWALPDLLEDIPRVEGVEVVMVNTTYGKVAEKANATDLLVELGVKPEQRGWMAFDKFFSVNEDCPVKTPETGLDCQPWQSMVNGTSPSTGNCRWWVQY
jgi:hypothetical protein